MYGCEVWTVKKAEHWRIDAFELWCWRRLSRVPWTARRSNQSILKEINPGISLEGMMLKVKLQHFGHLMRRVDSLEKTLMLEGLGAGGEGDDRGWGGWMVSPTWWTWVWVNSRSWWWTGRPGVLPFMGSQGVGHDWATVLNWTEFLYLADLDLCLKKTTTVDSSHVCVSCSVVSDSVTPWTVGSSVHGILQARILEWVAIPFSRRSSRPRDWTLVSYTAADFLLSEPPGKPLVHMN